MQRLFNFIKSKAFDTINHDILIKKLYHYGIRGVALEWFRNYLANRQQYVSVFGINSDTLPVYYGVPQGSVLGPLLFIIYTNDLPHVLKYSKCIMFADDTTVYHSAERITDTTQSLNKDLEALTDWFKANKLSLNVSKTNCMIFSQHQYAADSIKIKINDKRIDIVQSTKFLGIHIDEALNWSKHINYVCKKVSSGLYALNKMKHILFKEHMKFAYYSLIYPFIYYGITIWGNSLKKYTNKLFILQKRAVRHIIKAPYPYRQHTSPIFKDLEILKLNDIYNMAITIMMSNSNQCTVPTALQTMFIRNNTIHNHNTRQAQNPHTLSRKFNITQRSFLTTGPLIWSGIPQEIKSTLSINSLKYKLKHHLLNKY